jgi:hypothetical protein
MGLLRDLAKTVDGTDELSKTQQQLIETLGKFAEAKGQLLAAEMTKQLENAGITDKLVPIEAVLGEKIYAHAYLQQSSEKVSAGINEAINDITQANSKSEVVSAVGNTIGKAVAGFLGESSASGTTYREYKVFTEGLSIVRVDFYVWKEHVQVSGLLSEKVRTICALVLIKSAVDMSKIKLNTFLNLYQAQIEKITDHKAFAEAIDEVKQVFDRFHENSDEDD